MNVKAEVVERHDRIKPCAGWVTLCWSSATEMWDADWFDKKRDALNPESEVRDG